MKIKLASSGQGRPTTMSRLVRALRFFLRSEVGPKAWLLIGVLALLMLCINGMNVLNSYVGRDFMSAIEKHDRAGFVRLAWTYAGVFGISTVVAVLFRFAEERLALLWREWLTRRAVKQYLAGRDYLWLKESASTSNPDQRISEDVKSLTTSTISFLLMIVNGTVTVFSFSGVLWTISPALFGVAVLYAAVGSTLTFLLGRPLIRLNYRQSDCEANFRSELIRVAENAESIAIAGLEHGLRGQLNQRINALVGNFRRLIAVNRNLSFFTTGYNYMIQLIPALFVAPLFIDGHADFGIIGQSAMAFSTLLGAFSLVVTQFQAISSYASVATRLSEFTDAMEQKEGQGVALVADERAEGIVFDRLTLADEANGTVLVRELAGTVRPSMHLLVTGPNEAGKLAVFRSLAGLVRPVDGCIRRPPQTVTAFLAEQPYLPPLTLRGLLMPHGAVSDEDILAGARELELEEWLVRTGGLEASSDWDDVLAFPDRQMLLALRALLLKPAYLFLDHLDLALGRQREARILRVLADRGITCVSIAPDGAVPSVHREVLVMQPDGSWQWNAVAGDQAGGSPGDPA